MTDNDFDYGDGNYVKWVAETKFDEHNRLISETSSTVAANTWRSGQKKRIRPTDGILRACKNLNEDSIYNEKSDINIFKLHGSANWFFLPGNLPKEQLSVTHKIRRHGSKVTLNAQDHLEMDQSPHAENALIVPPSVIKPKLDSALREQWQGASKVIGEADALWFIGYSFPESDSFMRYFLAATLADNVRIRQLVVIDPSQSVKERSLGIFRAERLREAFHFLPVPWNRLALKEIANNNIDAAVPSGVLAMLDQRRANQRILSQEST